MLFILDNPYVNGYGNIEFLLKQLLDEKKPLSKEISKKNSKLIYYNPIGEEKKEDEIFEEKDEEIIEENNEEIPKPKKKKKKKTVSKLF